VGQRSCGEVRVDLPVSVVVATDEQGDGLWHLRVLSQGIPGTAQALWQWLKEVGRPDTRGPCQMFVPGTKGS